MKFPWRLFLYPQNFLWALVIMIFKLILLLPYKYQIRIARGLGKVLFYVNRKGRNVTLINLKQCFPLLSKKERYDLAKKSYLSVGIGLIELALAWFGDKKKLPPITIYGKELLEQSQANQKSILLISAHFHCLELVGRLISEQLPICAVYRPQKIHFLDALAKFYRKQTYQEIISSQNLRHLIKALKNKRTVWYTADIDGGKKNSIFSDFFGIPTATLSTTARLAENKDTECFTTFYYRKADYSGYEVFFEPLSSSFPSGDPQKDVDFINKKIEAAIMKNPDQYLWQYKRFKTRPVGSKSFY